MADMPIHDYLREHFRRCNEAIEKACEEAIQGGEHGVLLVRYPNGDIKVGVDPSVPYGQIHEMEGPPDATQEATS